MNALALALTFLQDDSTPTTPLDPHTAHAMAGLGAGIILFAVIFGLAIMAFLVFCLWRIFTKAGLSGALAFLIFVPVIGWVLPFLCLAFMEWKVVPTPVYGYVPPTPPLAAMPPAYPPAYPPAAPPVATTATTPAATTFPPETTL